MLLHGLFRLQCRFSLKFVEVSHWLGLEANKFLGSILNKWAWLGKSLICVLIKRVL